MTLYLSLCDCWGEISMQTVIKVDGTYFADESLEQDGARWTDYTRLFENVLKGRHEDEYLVYIGKV